MHRPSKEWDSSLPPNSRYDTLRETSFAQLRTALDQTALEDMECWLHPLRPAPRSSSGLREKKKEALSNHSDKVEIKLLSGIRARIDQFVQVGLVGMTGIKALAV